jgi:hypothetical protein
MVINYQLQLHQDNVNLTTLHDFKLRFVSKYLCQQESTSKCRTVAIKSGKITRIYSLSRHGDKRLKETQSAANSFEMELSWNNQLAHWKG